MGHGGIIVKKFIVSGIAAGVVAVGAAGQLHAQQISEDKFQTNVSIEIIPFAELKFENGHLLYLLIPPPGSTAPSSGVNFFVKGNANATLVAEPDAFVLVNTQDEGQQYLGRAVLNGNSVGYRLDLRFPRSGVGGGNPQTPRYAGLPGFEEGPTVPPLTVDLTSTGNQRTGVLHMETNPNWTPGGGIPLPGIYVGHVTLTLTASN